MIQAQEGHLYNSLHISIFFFTKKFSSVFCFSVSCRTLFLDSCLVWYIVFLVWLVMQKSEETSRINDLNPLYWHWWIHPLPASLSFDSFHFPEQILWHSSILRFPSDTNPAFSLSGNLNNYVNWEMPVYFLFRTKIWKFISFVILICSVPAKSENLDSTLKDH